MRLETIASLLILGWAGTALAQTPPAEPPKEAPPAAEPAPAPPPAPKPPLFTFAWHGFVSGSVGVQDAVLGPNQGQTAFYAQAKPGQDRLILTGDVRQTRLNFSVKGPVLVGGATPTAVVEIDFYAGGNPTGGFGNFGDESVIPRLRLGYVEANWTDTGTILRFGQFHNLLVVHIPASLAHIAFPYAYAAGMVGWRSPGVTLLQRIPIGGPVLELGVQVNRNKWADAQAACGAGQSAPTTNCIPFGPYFTGVTFGEAGTPQFQARILVTSGTTPSAFPLLPSVDWGFYLAGHYDQKDISGNGNTFIPPPANFQDKLDTVVGEAGFTFHLTGPVNFNLAGNAYVGKNTASLIGELFQFPASFAYGHNEVKEFGGWVQAGVGGGPVMIWGFLGTSHPNYEDAFAAGLARYNNVTSAVMLNYREGGYAFGLEWMHWFTKTRTYTATPTFLNLNANQLMGSLNYYF